MTNQLKRYFPMIREREELLDEISRKDSLRILYEQLSSETKKEFLDFYTGMKGAKILRDSFFKEVMNPEYAPQRLEGLLGILLGHKVRIVKVLPNDSTRIADETSLLITDIIVELEDGSLANVEIQKIGYAFPGERSACYSADMLLRQYKRVRAKQGKNFAYNQIKNVYLIVIYEKSPKEFKEFPDTFYHHSKQIFDSGLKLNLLQEFIMIPLDIYRKRTHNKPIETRMEAWLAFLSEDSPERIIELIEKFPEFKPMYETLYQMCLDVERVMDMFFSEELRILDRNTVQYMIEEQQKEIDEQKKVIEEQQKESEEQKKVIEEQQKESEKQNKTIDEQQKVIEFLKQQLDSLKR